MSTRTSHKPDWDVLPSLVAIANVFHYRILGMEKEFVFFTVLMVQEDKTIFTENENKWTFRQAIFINTGSSLEQ